MDFSEFINHHKNNIVSSVQELVRIDSTQGPAEPGKPFGSGPAKALETVLKMAEALGFSVTNLDNYVGYAEYGSGEETLALLTHVDVVPVGSGWKEDPFSARVSDGCIHGRGAYDDKSGCIASLYALQAVKESFPNRFYKKVRLIFGANEETGMQDIPYYLDHEKEPDYAFSPDAPFPVGYGEKGILDLNLRYFLNESQKNQHIVSLQGGDLVKFVPDNCTVQLRLTHLEHDTVLKRLSDFEEKYSPNVIDNENGLTTITFYGKRVFAVKPQNGVNAISGLMDFLNSLDFLKEESNGCFDYFMSHFNYETDGNSIQCARKDEISTALTLNVGTVAMAGNSITFGIHIRYPVLIDAKELLDCLHLHLNTDKLVLHICRHSPAHYVPKESVLVKTLMDVYRTKTGQSNATPIVMEGGTYARCLKNGVSFGMLFPDRIQTAHTNHEFVVIDDILKAIDIYAEAIYRLCIN